MDEMTLEQRVEKIEGLISKIISLAKEHPVGRMIVARLGSDLCAHQ